MKHTRLISVLICSMLIAVASALVIFSFHARNRVENNNLIAHQDIINSDISQADDYFLDGRRKDAVACVDNARDKAMADIQDPARRAQLVACAMSYCGYDEKNKAVAVLQKVVEFKDKSGQEAKEILDGISRNDPAWRPRTIPSAAARAQLKAMKAQMLNNPTMAKGFVEQYMGKH